MLRKPKDDATENQRVRSPVQQFQPAPVVNSEAPDTADGVSTISSDITIVGKITGKGAIKIFGRIEGDLHASIVVINDGAEVDGDIVAEELTMGGRVKGTIHANRVKLTRRPIP
jgi:cytoskeletal protein CcmA (bactofilin family)